MDHLNSIFDWIGALSLFILGVFGREMSKMKDHLNTVPTREDVRQMIDDKNAVTIALLSSLKEDILELKIEQKDINKRIVEALERSSKI